MLDVGNSGYSWSSTVSGGTRAFSLLLYAPGLNPSNAYYRAFGFQVRCLQHLPAFCSVLGQCSGQNKGPAPGYRGNGEGALWNVGRYGEWWSSTVSETNAFFLRFHATYANPSDKYYRAHGFQVRCLQHLPALCSVTGQ